MSAEVLRQAAALMRERAEAVLSWQRANPDLCGGAGAWFTPVFVANAFEKEAFGGSVSTDRLREGWRADGDHVASWHPAVALAVADLLDVWAREDLMSSKFTLPEERACITALVDAYLGSDQ